MGYRVSALEKERSLPTDFEDRHRKMVNKVKDFTMTSPERIFGLMEAVDYVVRNKVQGDIVECGVWRGGSMLCIAEELLAQKDNSRQLYLYDTFEGMPPPTTDDVDFSDQKAASLLIQEKDKENSLIWAYSTLDSVKKTMAISEYPGSKIQYIVGKVEDTIPRTLPEKIALLRLDTDWYESTRHELIHLFPKLVPGGVLIIDDYGFWKGARKAVDEYLAENSIQILLNRMDDTGRIAIKQ